MPSYKKLCMNSPLDHHLGPAAAHRLRHVLGAAQPAHARVAGAMLGLWHRPYSPRPVRRRTCPNGVALAGRSRVPVPVAGTDAPVSIGMQFGAI